MGKKMIVAGLIVAAVALPLIFGGTVQNELGQKPIAADEPKIEWAGYFKSKDRARVRAFHSSRKLNKVEALALFEPLTRAQGQVFRAVVYSGSDNQPPYDALTLAPSLQQALIVTTNPPHDDWDWIFFANPAGKVTLRAR